MAQAPLLDGHDPILADVYGTVRDRAARGRQTTPVQAIKRSVRASPHPSVPEQAAHFLSACGK